MDTQPSPGAGRRPDLGKMLFNDSSTDMAMAQAVPLFDVYKDGFAPVRAC